MDEHKKRSSLAAERMRRHRARRREGMRCLVIEVHDQEIETLVELGLLDPDTRDDRSAITVALYIFLEESFKASSGL